MNKFPYVIVEIANGLERTVAKLANLHVAQSLWRTLEDSADHRTRYVIMQEQLIECGVDELCVS